MRSSKSLSVGLILGLVFACSAVAQSYRMETHVYQANDDSIVARNLTLFDGGLIIDFRLDPDLTGTSIREITIYDQTRQTFVLLDVEREIKLELDRSRLIQILESLRAELQTNEATRYLADVKFVEREDIDQNRIELDGGWVQYVVSGRHPAETSVLPLYQDFLDHFTMLSASDPMSLPPFARLSFNRVLKKYGWLADRIELTIAPQDQILPAIHVYSTHLWGMKLSPKDRSHLETARKYWAQFRSVNLAEYRGLSAAEATRASRRK